MSETQEKTLDEIDAANYPLYPVLTEAGQKQAQELIDKFKAQMVKVAEEALSDLYCDCVMHIESDSWANFRNHLMDGLRNYKNKEIQGEYDFGEIRRAIFEEFRDEIIQDIPQDIVKENENLKEEVQRLRKLSCRGY